MNSQPVFLWMTVCLLLAGGCSNDIYPDLLFDKCVAMSNSRLNKSSISQDMGEEIAKKVDTMCRAVQEECIKDPYGDLYQKHLEKFEY